jgi:hypothetical protein
MMNFDIDEETYNEIAKVIHCDASPVGIDAKKTHILILKVLSALTKKIDEVQQEIKEITAK